MFIYIIDVVVRLFGLGWNSFRANGWNLFDIVVAGGSFVTTLIVRFGSTDFVIQQLQKLFLVSIAFKLVQRTNSLNVLFKTAVYVPLFWPDVSRTDHTCRASLPVILSLLSLWIILFIFFAILYVEVFSMTKWGSGETRTRNYSSMGSSLVMLAFMSVGLVFDSFEKYSHPNSPRFLEKGGTSICTISTLSLCFLIMTKLGMQYYLLSSLYKLGT